MTQVWPNAMCRGLVVLFLGLMLLSTASSCDGYGDLPLPQRQTAEAVIEGSDLYFGRVGTVQMRIDLPETSAGPYYLVAPPAIIASNASSVRWAAGACKHPGTPTPELGPSSIRICITVVLAGGEAAAAPFEIYTIVEDRGHALRYDATAAVEP